MDLLDSTELSDANVLSVILSGMFEGETDMVRLSNPRQQLERIIYQSRNMPIIQSRNYHFQTSSSNPSSEEVYMAFQILLTSSSYLEGVGHGNDFLAHSNWVRMAEIVLETKDVSQEDYGLLQSLGQMIEVEERYSKVDRI